MARLRLLVVAASAFAFSATLSAQTIFVTTVNDVVDFAAPQTVAQLPGPDGKVSFREACIAANNTAGPQTIGFQVPMGQWGGGTFGPRIVNAGVSFPVSGDNTTIDGTTQTSFTGDLNPNGAEVSFNSTAVDPAIVVTGIINVSADHCLITGLGDMSNRNIGIDFLATAEENTVTNCVIKGKFAAIRVQGDRNTIGSTTPGQGNKLSSLSDGLRIHGLGLSVAQDNVVIGNYLTGEFNGVQIVGNATGNRIGGFLPGEANLINLAGYLQEDGTPDGALIRIETDATGNFVYGNFLGTTDLTGTAAADNTCDVGVEIYGDQNLVKGNVIAGIAGPAGFLAVQAGISLREGAELNVIQGNWIGVDKTGLIPLANHIGIQISAFDTSLPMPLNNLVGGINPGEGNVIAFNDSGGITVLLDSTGNRITRNSIHDNHANAALGIDLGADGATANDGGDSDTGPNGLQNSPVLVTAVTSAAGGTVVSGHIDTANPQTVSLEFFSNPAPGVGEIVEAKTFLGIGVANANGTFAVALPTATAGLAITATATDLAGNTSEISGAVLTNPSPWVNLGLGLAGTNGTAVLSGAGTLAGNTEFGLALTGAKPNAAGVWVAGGTAINFPLFGGTFVPSPDTSANFVTDGSGNASIVATWPPSITPGSPIFVQAWFIDSGSINGVIASSNAIQGTTP